LKFIVETIPTLTHATERDVDLLLVEELIADISFVELVIAKAFGRSLSRSDIKAHGVHHSKRRILNRREIDITLTVDRFDKLPIIVMLENKLDTSDQPLQAESYKSEAEDLVAGGYAEEVRTLLVCPEHYRRENSTFEKKFDGVLIYEEVLAHLRSRLTAVEGELALRLNHRANLIDQAITKGRRGYDPVPFAPIAAFNAEYVSVVRDQFPKLVPGPAMLKTDRLGESVTMIFGPGTLPAWEFLPQMRLVHQLREGNVNVNFYGWGDFFSELASQIGSDLRGTGFKIVPTINKRKNGHAGLMLFSATPVVTNGRSLAEQQVDVVSGIAAAERLRSWIWANEAVIAGWAEIVGGHSAG
jgi:hypothetical protein